MAEADSIAKIDHEALLRKYIQHVGECEGIDFLRDDDRERHSDRVKWTDEEWAELLRLTSDPEQA